MNLQKNFNYLKASKGYSYRDISIPTSVNMNTINTIANGNENNIRIETIVRLANFFELSLDEFILSDLEEKTNEKEK